MKKNPIVIIFVVFLVIINSLIVFTVQYNDEVVQKHIATLTRRYIIDGDIPSAKEQLNALSPVFLKEFYFLEKGKCSSNYNQVDFYYDIHEKEKVTSLCVKPNRHIIFLTFILVNGVLIICLVGGLWLQRRFSEMIIENEKRSFSKFLSQLESLLSGKINQIDADQTSGMSETDVLMSKVVEVSIERMAKSRVETKMAQMARQVSHDLRSPVAALSMIISTLTAISKDQRSCVCEATERITDITNKLLEYGKSEFHGRSEVSVDIKGVEINSLTVEDLARQIESIVSEKKWQYKDHHKIEINFRVAHELKIYVKVNSTEFKRVISNIINNSVEAIEAKPKGLIDIELCTDEKDAILVIKDNGCGIPPNILCQLGSEKISFGKELIKGTGFGLGVFHAFRTIESFGGTICYESVEKQGVEIKIKLPMVKIK